MSVSRCVLILLLGVVALSLVGAETGAADAKPKTESKKVSVGNYLVKVEDQVKALLKSVKNIHQQDPYVVYALVGSGFVLGGLFYLVFSPAKSGHRKPSGFKRKQK